MLKLDALYNSYDAVLEEVKQQLGDIDLTDEHISRIVNRLSNTIAFRERVAENCVKDLTLSITDASRNDLEQNKQMRGLIEAIANRVMLEASDAIGRVIETKIVESFPDDKIVDMMDAHLMKSKPVQFGFKAAFCLNQMLAYLGYTKAQPTTDN